MQRVLHLRGLPFWRFTRGRVRTFVPRGSGQTHVDQLDLPRARERRGAIELRAAAVAGGTSMTTWCGRGDGRREAKRPARGPWAVWPLKTSPMFRLQRPIGRRRWRGWCRRRSRAASYGVSANDRQIPKAKVRLPTETRDSPTGCTEAKLSDAITAKSLDYFSSARVTGIRLHEPEARLIAAEVIERLR